MSGRPPADDLTFNVDDIGLNDALLSHLSKGEADSVWNLLIGRFLDGSTIAQLGDGAIKSALRELGSQWEHDSNGIFVEHRATDICIQVIQQMKMIATHSSPKFRATGGSELGGRMSCDHFHLLNDLDADVRRSMFDEDSVGIVLPLGTQFTQGGLDGTVAKLGNG